MHRALRIKLYYKYNNNTPDMLIMIFENLLSDFNPKE